jgi:cell division protease FtsH
VKSPWKRITKKIVVWASIYFAVAYLLLGLGPKDALLHFGENFAQMRTLILTGIMLMGFMVGQFVAMFWFLGRGTTYTLYPGEYDIGFDDVRGQWAAVSSVKETVHLFEGLREFKDVMGGEPPKGVLMEGPPGTGKTLLAKAVAGEAGVPFLFANGSGFSSMFMGIGNMKMRSLFSKARKMSDKFGGAVVFIDEIDTIGGTRGAVTQQSSPMVDKMIMGAGMGGGGGVINELLVQMDGLTTPKGLKRHLRRLLGLRKAEVPFYNLLIIAATNRASTLDPALLRAGRFDRKIHVGLPNGVGRADIAAYYLAKVRHLPVDVEKFAQATQGYSPAAIKGLVNEALIIALQDGRKELCWDDLWKAKVAEEIGLVQAAEYTDQERDMVATHEAAHAVLSHVLHEGDRVVQIATIRKRESALGLVSYQDVDERFLRTREEIEHDIMVSLAGLVAEELFFKTITTGPSSDLQAATRRAAAYVGLYGMGDRLTVSLPDPNTPDPVQAVLSSKAGGEKTEKLLQALKQRTAVAVRNYKAAIELVRDALVEKSEIIGDEVQALLKEATK